MQVSSNWDVHELQVIFDFLIDNIFVDVGSIVFQQVIGIPMGTDCAPLVADLFLFSFEFRFMKELIHTNQPLAGQTVKIYK